MGSRSTQNQSYTNRLTHLESTWWKKLIPVQLPYRMFLRSLNPGQVLEIGCGIGRNLRHLHPNIVGVDHNATSVSVALSQGLTAYTPTDFQNSRHAKESQFDTLLFSHILEHMTEDEATSLLQEYLPHLSDQGRVVIICPQEAGYASDSTHVTFMNLETISQILKKCGLKVVTLRSFPFPRFAGKIFKYNEFVGIGRKV
jgi:2-polyprenyl-3-methyl-5-hydroxy-6-metoxy-1,4-benzoquinol methylase